MNEPLSHLVIELMWRLVVLSCSPDFPVLAAAWKLAATLSLWNGCFQSCASVSICLLLCSSERQSGRFPLLR